MMMIFIVTLRSIIIINVFTEQTLEDALTLLVDRVRFKVEPHHMSVMTSGRRLD